MARVYKIRSFNMSLGSMTASNSRRSFSIVGDSGAIFSLEIRNAAGSYYNFSTNTFGTPYKRLKNRRLGGGIYNGSIAFPEITTSTDQYDIYLFAESMHGTTHAKYSEVRFADGSLDINTSTGSNSNLLKKVIYQYANTTVTLSALAPSTLRGTTDFSSMSVSADTFTVGRGNNIGKTSFSVGVTVAATKAVQIIKQPVVRDLLAYTTAVFGDPVKIDGEDIWAGTVRSTDTTNGVVSGETVTMDATVASKMKVGDRVTGTGIPSTSVVTVSSLSGTYTFNTSEVVTIGDEVTLTFTPPYYYRWNVASGSSIHKLQSGMIYVDSDWPLIDKVTIGPYKDTTTYTVQINNADGSIDEVENTVTNVSVPALDPLGYKPTILKGFVTNQLGNITFNDQIINDVDNTNAKVFYAYGPDVIKKVYNTEIVLTDLKVELIVPTTTTTEATSAHTTIAVTDREGAIDDVSTVSGVGIRTSAPRSRDTVDGVVSSATKIVLDNNVAGQMKIGDRVTGTRLVGSTVEEIRELAVKIITVAALNPDGDNAKEFSVSEAVSINDGVTLIFTPRGLPTITSGGGADGAGDWVLSTPQSLESGVTLSVGGTSRRATITGNIEFVNVDDSDFTLYFDVEKFLSAS